MSDYESYQEASGWLGPLAIPLGMYGRRLQFIAFDSDGNREMVLTGVLRGVESESYRLSSVEGGHRWTHNHSVSLWVPSLTSNGDPDETITLPLNGNLLWKEIP